MTHDDDYRLYTEVELNQIRMHRKAAQIMAELACKRAGIKLHPEIAFHRESLWRWADDGGIA